MTARTTVSLTLSSCSLFRAGAQAASLQGQGYLSFFRIRFFAFLSGACCRAD